MSQTAYQYSVRPASSADGAAIALLEQLSFAQPWQKTAIEEELGHSEAANFAAIDDQGVLVGYALCRSFIDELQVFTIAVHPAHRQKGIGTALLAQAEATARLQGKQLLLLEVRISNASAIALYKKLDFYVLYRRKGYYQDGEEAMVMAKDLVGEKAEGE